MSRNKQLMRKRAVDAIVENFEIPRLQAQRIVQAIINVAVVDDIEGQDMPSSTISFVPTRASVALIDWLIEREHEAASKEWG